MRLKNLMWLLFGLSLVGLLAGVFNPEPPPLLFKHSDKVEHIAAFFVVSLCGTLCIRGKWYLSLYWSVCLVMAYLLEYGQGYYLPKRTFDPYDVYANSIGVFVAFFVWIMRINKYKKM